MKNDSYRTYISNIDSCRFLFNISKLPRWLRNWVQRHSLITDLIACILTYILLGGTITALFASAWMGIMISILLAVINNPNGKVLLDYISVKLSNLKTLFSESIKNISTIENKTVTDSTGGNMV